MTGGITVYGAGYTSTQSNGNAAGLYYFWGASNCMTELLLDATGPRVLPTAPYEEAARALEVGVETAAEDPTYEDLAQELAEQFLWIARAMNCMRPDGMWDEDDGFRYDVLRLPDGRSTRLEVRSMVGPPAALRHDGHRALAARAPASLDECLPRPPAAAREHGT